MEVITNKLTNLSYKQTKEFLTKQDTNLLRELVVYLDDLYYNTGDSVLEDDKYDLLKEVLLEKDKDYVPTVGATLREGENRSLLPFFLGSADKITPEDEPKLNRWKQYHKAPYIISDKLDGISCLLHRKKNKLSLFTRGDGVIGADISYLAPFLRLPELKEDISVRGELILKKDTFETKYKNKTVNDRVYKNSRNMISGLIGSKTARNGLSDIDFVVYEIVADNPDKPSTQLKTLKTLGFNVVKHISVPSISVQSLSELLPKFRRESPYEIDGIIVQTDHPYDRSTSKFPDYLFAFKMLMIEDIHTTKVLDVEWNISKWGQLKPVIVVEPIEAKGVTMRRATAHNAKYVVENNLAPGAIVRITRSKEVIPYIVEVLKPAKAPKMPAEEFTWDKNNVNIILTRFDYSMCVKLISGFFSHLNIKHVSEETVSKLFDAGFNNLLKIIGASKQDFLKVPEFQDKSAERIYTNIHSGLQNVKISDVLGASGVLGYGIGSRKIEALLLDMPDLFTLYKKKNKEELVQLITSVHGFSLITAVKIADNLKYADQFLQKISKYATFKTNKRVSDQFKGEKIVMSGFRSKELETKIAERGGKVNTSVSSATTILIVADKNAPLTGKAQKAQENGIPIYSRAEFEKLLT